MSYFHAKQAGNPQFLDARKHDALSLDNSSIFGHNPEVIARSIAPLKAP